MDDSDQSMSEDNSDDDFHAPKWRSRRLSEVSENESDAGTNKGGGQDNDSEDKDTKASDLDDSNDTENKGKDVKSDEDRLGSSDKDKNEYMLMRYDEGGKILCKTKLGDSCPVSMVEVRVEDKLCLAISYR